jgi:predicted RNA binding protein YcfA (HicA-like mRNA interferase family)
LGKLPVTTPKKLIKILKLIGYEFDHKRGSHIILRKNEYPHRRITVPEHKEIAKGTLRSIIKESGLSLIEFLDLYKQV